MKVAALGTFFVLLSMGDTLYNFKVEQASYVSGLVGSTIKLPCYLRDDDNMVERAHIYWMFRKSAGQDEMLFPEKPNKTPRVQLLNISDWKDMSISLSKLRFSDTNVYKCRISVLTRNSSQYISGTGTSLHVYGPLKTEIDGLNISCKTQVQVTENNSLVWNFGVMEAFSGKTITDQWQESDGTFWMSSHVTFKEEQCSQIKENGFLTCALKHSLGYILNIQTVKIPCKGTNPPVSKQPVVFYTLLLGSSLFILLLVILIFFKRKRYLRSRLRQRWTLNIPYNDVRHQEPSTT